MKPVFSIVIPNYNSSNTIASCLDSIFSMDYKNYEVIIVDDNSTDDSVSIINKYKEKYKDKLKLIQLGKKAGAAGARNIGVKNSKGNIIMFTDTDIINYSNTLTKAEKLIKKYRDASAFVGIFSPELVHKNLLSNYKHLYLCYYFIKQDDFITTLNTSLTFIEKTVFEKVNGFDPAFGVIGEDVELGTRLVKNGYKIRLCRSLHMVHLKKYKLSNFVKDEVIRARKMFRIFLRTKFVKNEKNNAGNSYKLRPISLYISLALTASLIVIVIAYIITGFKVAYYAILALVLMLITTNISFWSYLKSQRGFIFALKSAFVTIFDMLLMLFGMGLALKDFIMGRDSFQKWHY